MNKEISTEISSAKARIDEAELALQAAIAAMESGQRANKMTVSEAVGEALQRLHDAHAILVRLELRDPVDESR